MYNCSRLLHCNIICTSNASSVTWPWFTDSIWLCHRQQHHVYYSEYGVYLPHCLSFCFLLCPFSCLFCRKWFPVTVIFILVVASKTYVLLLMLWMHKYTVAIFLHYHSFMLVSDTCILFLLLTRGPFLAIWEQLAFEGWIQKFAKETGTGWSVSCEF